MKVAFVAGPYRSKEGAWFVKRNIHQAEEVAAALWLKGYAVICPQSNSAFFSGLLPEEWFIKGYIELVDRSDIMVMAPGWMQSDGACREYSRAEEKRIPIYLGIEDVPQAEWS